MFQGEAHKCALRSTNCQAPGGHPVTQGSCSFMHVGLGHGQCRCTADYGDIVSICEELRVEGDVEVRQEDVEEERAENGALLDASADGVGG